MNKHLISTIKEGLLKEYDLLEAYSLAELETPDWNSVRRTHNWRRYVPDVCIELWEELSEETKLVVYVMAQEQAHREVWD